MHEQILNRQQTAVDQHISLDDQASPVLGCYAGQSLREWHDQDQVIGQEASQLACRIHPAWAQQGIGKVHRRTEKHPPDDGL